MFYPKDLLKNINYTVESWRWNGFDISGFVRFVEQKI